jgi:PPP family 3-phenylpropionic acid transporter
VTAAQPPPHSTKPQYFLSYAVLGSLVPFVSVLLAERGLDKSQIGTVWAVASLGVVVTPVLVTLLADTAIAARLLMAGLFVLAGFFLAGLWGARTFWPILILYALHTFALQPVFALQDGIHFAAQSIRRTRGLDEVPYHTVRVWGTIGYILPSTLLWFLLRPGESMTPAVGCGTAFCALSVVSAFFLPHTPPPPRAESHARLPTAAAARALLEPHVLVFCAAMFLLYLTSQAFYEFYPLHLTERCGVDNRWIGMITNVGTVGEVFYMLAFAWLAARLTVRRVMYLGALAIAARFFLLAAFPQLSVAIGVQLIHGMTVLAMGVVPPIFLNRHATDECRNSIQGLYAMLVLGGGKVIGSQLFGRIAQGGLPRAFNVAGVMCVVAMGMLYFAFREEKRET